MALTDLRKLATDCHTSVYFSLMADVTDSSNREQQVVGFLSRIDKDLEAHKEFIGLYKVKEASVDIMTNVLSNVLCRIDLLISNCQGQCYDRASNVSGVRCGVTMQFYQKSHMLCTTIAIAIL